MQNRKLGTSFAKTLARARKQPVATLIAGLLCAHPGAALGQEAEAISIELNRLEQADGSCQAYLVVGNATQASFDSLGLDLVMFDPEGIVSRRIAVELAPLPAGKTSVRVFSIEGSECDSVGRVLLNSVVSCRDGSGDRPDCLGLVEPSSRAAAPFIQ